MKSNLECWRQMQEAGYFHRHPLYGGYKDCGHNDIEKIERFIQLNPAMTVAIIGCGYGREAAHICKKVRAVYGIDVSDGILAAALEYVRVAGSVNFIPVTACTFLDEIPSPIDLVYSVTVMQHITRDLVVEYLQKLGAKLATDGRMLIQFLELEGGGDKDAEIAVYEPAVSWSRKQIDAAANAAGLTVLDVKTDVIRSGCVWHWAYLGK